MRVHKIRLLAIAAISVICVTQLSGDDSPNRPVADTIYDGVDGDAVFGVRCGSHVHTPEEATRFRDSLKKFQNVRLVGGPTEIPVAFHIVRQNDGSADVSDQQILSQIDVLNESFEPYGYTFILKSVDRINNSRWSRHLPGTPLETAMKNSLADDPATTLNFYTCDLGLGLLGYATFPDTYPERSNMHGVVVLYSSLPGGRSAPFNLGKTAVHEVGHYLGLFHTFQGGCSGLGDEVADTPAEASPASGCPVGRDTCPSPGLDPVNNYMNYSNDACLTEFTEGQRRRMDGAVMAFKPSLLENVETPEPEIRVNNASGSITLGTNQQVDVEVELDANDMEGAAAEYWVVAQSRDGIFTLDLAADAWQPELEPSLQANVIDFGSTKVFSANSLPRGEYTLYFGIDLLPNDRIDLDASYVDSIDVTVE